jgi:hypothetical protein
MSSRYNVTDPSLEQIIRDLTLRISKLERTPQLPNSGVDTGSVTTIGSGGSSFQVLSGDMVPSEITAFYAFFGRTTYVCNIWSRGNANDYEFIASTSMDAESPLNLLIAHGSVSGGVVSHQYDQTLNFGGTNPRTWFGLIDTSELVVGSSIFPGSNLVLQSAGIMIESYPAPQVWLPVSILTADCNSDLTLSTTLTDVSGAVVSTAIPKTAKVIVTGVFDFEETVVGTTVCVGDLIVDGGSAQARKARLGVSAVGDRATVTQTWVVDLTPGGDAVVHEFKLQGSKSLNAGTQVARASGTNITAQVYVQ